MTITSNVENNIFRHARMRRSAVYKGHTVERRIKDLLELRRHLYRADKNYERARELYNTKL